MQNRVNEIMATIYRGLQLARHFLEPTTFTFHNPLQDIIIAICQMQKPRFREFK